MRPRATPCACGSVALGRRPKPFTKTDPTGESVFIDSTAFTSRTRPQTAPKRVRAKSEFRELIQLIWVVSSPRTNILLSEYQKCVFSVPPRQEGRFAVVTNVGRNAVDVMVSPDERRWLRTAKSCGPGAPTLALSFRRAQFLRKRRGQKSPVPGESAI
jgi:hypothetical protein